MPQYLFENTETGETISLFYHMKDAPKVGSIIENDEGSWKRVT